MTSEYLLTDKQKAEYVDKQIELFSNQITTLTSRVDELVLLQAQCNFFSEVTGNKTTSCERSIRHINEQIRAAEHDLNTWTTYKNEHQDLWSSSE